MEKNKPILLIRRFAFSTFEEGCIEMSFGEPSFSAEQVTFRGAFLKIMLAANYPDVWSDLKTPLSHSLPSFRSLLACSCQVMSLKTQLLLTSLKTHILLKKKTIIYI